MYFFTIECVTCSQVLVYVIVQAAFQHGIMAPLRRPRWDPPPPELAQPPHPPLRNEDHRVLAGGDAPALQHVPMHRADDARLDRNNVHQRHRSRENPAPIHVETLRNADRQLGEDEPDERRKRSPETEEEISAESGTEEQQETQNKEKGATAVANTTQPKNKRTEPDSSQKQNKPFKEEERSQNKPRDGAAARPRPAERRPPQNNVQVSLFKCTQLHPVRRLRVVFRVITMKYFNAAVLYKDN